MYNWITYLKNIVKARHNLIVENMQLKRYISDMHARHNEEMNIHLQRMMNVTYLLNQEQVLTPVPRSQNDH